MQHGTESECGEVIPGGVGGSRATEGKCCWKNALVVVVRRDGVSESVEGVWHWSGKTKNLSEPLA
jgi:hypothetical protein